MSQLVTGTVVAQRYRIQRLLGVGGMGSVYEATDVLTSQRHAVKVLHPQFLHHPVIPRRFMQEATAAQALVTPHAVKVDGTGTLEDGSPYLVMEYLDGLDLGEVTRRAGGRLPLERALALVDQVAAALQEAHAGGIIGVVPAAVALISVSSWRWWRAGVAATQVAAGEGGVR